MSAFGCDLVAREQFVDFSSAFAPSSPSGPKKPDGVVGLLTFLTPKIKSSSRDMKHEVTRRRRIRCESWSTRAPHRPPQRQKRVQKQISAGIDYVVLKSNARCKNG